jgi:glycosyltransferase involved in cell wall biosynthesis
VLISIVIPVYNEADALVDLGQGVRQELTRLGQPWEIIFINDGSTDGSAKILDRLADSDQRIRVIHFKRNSGQTAAMMAGFDFAQGDVIIPLDGDGQNDPADIPRMLNLIDQGFDVVSGWRKDRQDNVIQRNIPSILANRLISAVSGVRLQATGSRRDPLVWGDAPVPSYLCVLAWSENRRARGESSSPAYRGIEIRF